MFIVEATVAATLWVSSAKRQDSDPDCLVDSGTGIGLFQIASGRSMERTMVDDIGNMDGVVDVSVKRTGNAFDVAVVMQNMDFGPFNAVIQKELDFYSRYPGYTFNFDLMPVAALDA